VTISVASPRRPAVRLLMAALLAMSIVIVGLPAAAASAGSSNTLATVVLKIGSQITVTSSPDTASPDTALTLTATFAVVPGNENVHPTGVVHFLDGTTLLGTGDLTGGQTAVLPTQFATPGPHSITASYEGDANYAAGVSAILPITVSTALQTTTTVTVASVVTDANQAVVTITAKVSAGADGETVNFMNNNTQLWVSTLKNGTATVSPTLALGTYAISAQYVGDSTYETSTSASQAVTVTPPGGSLRTITPVRILDTRSANGAPKAKLAAHSELVLQVTGRGGIPATGVADISVNITVVLPAANGVVTVYPAGGVVVPATANVDFLANQNTAGLVITNVNAAGQIAIFNKSNGPLDLIADVSAWFAQQTGSVDQQGRYNAVVPFRLLDTRKTARMKNGTTVPIAVEGVGTIPKTGVAAVMLNVTSVNPSAPGYLFVYPGGTTMPPLVSTTAFQKAETRAGRVIVGVGSDGKVDLYNSPWASTDVVVDIAGWFTSASSKAGGSTYIPLPVSQRLTSAQTGGSLWGRATTRSIPIAGVVGIPTQKSVIHASAVVSNLHVSAASTGGYLTAYPLPVRPTTSDLNFTKGATLQNLSIATLGPTGAFNLYNYNGTATVTIDIYGWFG
jgi:hypothetical protein